jgi:hypothetical protein
MVSDFALNDYSIGVQKEDRQIVKKIMNTKTVHLVRVLGSF